MKLTRNEFFETIQAEKPNNYEPPDWEVKNVISENGISAVMKICNVRVVEFAIRYRKYVRTRNA